jgi:hypothetical protein
VFPKPPTTEGSSRRDSSETYAVSRLALAGLKIEDTDIIPIHVPRLTAVCASSCASSDDEEAGQSQQALCSETAE